jgi:hypothetical protein
MKEGMMEGSGSLYFQQKLSCLNFFLKKQECIDRFVQN